MGRIKELNSIRGLAALAVVLFHYTTKYNENFEPDAMKIFEFKYGYLGVHLFFILSGFVIFMTIGKVKSGFDFIYKRFIRLYPVFWVCLIFTFSVTSIGSIEKFERTWTELVINFTMIPSLLKTRAIDGAYWSLAPEILFYVFIWGVYKIKLLHKIEIICFIWLVASFIISYSGLSSILFVLLNVKYCFLFIAGINFYKLYIEKNNNMRWVNHFLIAISLLYCYLFNPIVETIFCIAFFEVFYLFIYKKLSFIGKIKPFVFLGIISYPLYLIHQFFGLILIYYLCKISIDNHFILLFIPLGLAIILAYVVTFYFEKPLLLKFKSTHSIPENLNFKAILSKKGKRQI